MADPEKYTTIAIPNELIEEIDKVLERDYMGFKSKTEFIKQAIRDNLQKALQELKQRDLDAKERMELYKKMEKDQKEAKEKKQIV